MRRTLFITSSRIGDSVITTGILSELIAESDAITIVASPLNHRLFAAVPRLERLIVLRKYHASLHWIKLWSMVVFFRWDRVVDCRGSALGWFLWARQRLVHRQGRGIDAKVAQLGAMIGREESPPLPQLWLTETAAADAARRMVGDRFLAVAPTANWLGKQWPMERYIQLLQRVTAAGGVLAGYRIAVFAAPNERDRLKTLWQAFAPAMIVDVTGESDLQMVAACLARCDYFIGNDSGLMHMAAALGVRTLGLFGPSDDRVYAPAGVAARLVRTVESNDELHQRLRDSGALDLMRSLSVEQVETALSKLVRDFPVG
ncbi:MAG: glycosyltransferase family 9 protein [Candidatus Pacebacteria bacterium]|nr:glycosyltransferase family 9 protein [Candidatus Paceibacterota bacterium]